MGQTISSLTGFIRKISQTTFSNRSIRTYRGHSDRATYKLEPSVFRNAKYRSDERNLVREIVALHPGEFTGDNTTLERLVRMQHFSLPTRLLDVTANPLVALYFACKSHPSKSGEVISFTVDKRRVRYFDSDTASCIANLSNLSVGERNALRKFNDVTSLNSAPEALRLLHFIKSEKPYFLPMIDPDDLKSVIFVKAKQNNRRILAQQGAFLLFGLINELTDNNAHSVSIERIIINGSHKLKILAELDSVSINDSTLFPEIEIAARYIMKKLAPDV